MVKKILSSLIAAILLLSQPLEVLAQRNWVNDFQKLQADGLGFFSLDFTHTDDQQTAFVMQNSQGAIWLTSDAIWLTQWEKLPDLKKGQAPVKQNRQGVHLKVTFPGSSKQVQMEVEQQLAGHVSILKGQNQSAWNSDLPLWGVVRYQDLYPGVDLVIRSTRAGFTWDYDIEFGADTRGVRMQVEGGYRIGEDSFGPIYHTAIGNLSLPDLSLVGEQTAQQGSAHDSALTAYFGRSSPSLLDSSEKLAYSTFLGGGYWDSAKDVAVDAEGAVYAVGETASIDFPVTPGAFDITVDQTDVLALKLSPGGSLIYATYIGGISQETGWSVAVENQVAYIGGETSSEDFPTTTGLVYGMETDAFVFALNPSGTQPVFSRYIGGKDQDRGYGIAVNSGNVYLTGITYSSDFPGGGYYANGDVFSLRLNNTGGINYSRITGGNAADAGFGIAVQGGIAWVTGETWSGNFSTGNQGEDDLFLFNLSTAGSILTNRTFGGASQEYGEDIALNAAGEVHVVGTTSSSNFPFTEGVLNGPQDAFLLKVNAANTQLIYATALGGSDIELGKVVALDRAGGVIVVGSTHSSNFPVTSDAYQPVMAGGTDVFVTRYFLAGSTAGRRTYSTYLGGSGNDEATSVAVDNSVFAYVVGSTESADFPTTPDAYDAALNGPSDAFLSVLSVGPLPTISIQKLTNGEDANDVPGPYVTIGSQINWRYDVKNNGAVELHDVHVTDNQGVQVSCPKTFLQAGESMLCTGSGSAVKGQYSNLGTVTAVSPYQTTVGAVDASHYFGGDPKTRLVKKINGVDANSLPGIYVELGSAVTWTYEVINDGNVDLTGVQVVDDNGTPSDNSDDVVICMIPLLEAGITDTTTCTMSGTAEAGQYTNIAVVTGTAPGQLGDVSDDDPSSYFGSAPALTVVLKINEEHITTGPGPYLLVGNAITWKYDLQNTGNVALTQIMVVDDNGTPSTGDDRTVCSGVTLAPGASTSCTITGQAAAGQYHNTATASGTPPVGAVIIQDDSYYFGAQPQVDLEYSVNGDPADSAPGVYVLAGSQLALSYLVTNTGNVPLTSLEVKENNVTICTINELVAGASQSCGREMTALTGQKSMSASLTAMPPGSLTAVNKSDSANYFGAAPSLSVAMQTNGQASEAEPGVYLEAGSPVTWTYTITNKGNVPLTHVLLLDDHGTPGSPEDDQSPAACTDASLAVNASLTCSLTGTAVIGQYRNLSSVTANPPGDLLPISGTALGHYFGSVLDVSIKKQTNGMDAEEAPGPLVAAGASITWIYHVTNRSNVSVDISVRDDNGTPENTGDDATFCAQRLNPAAEATCTRTGSALPGPYANTAVVTATPPVGLLPISTQDTSHYFGVVTGVDIITSTNGQDANTTPGPYIHVGDPVHWTYRVTNIGNVGLTLVTVSDSHIAAVSCPGTSLQPSESMTCTASGLAVLNQYENTGTVTANPPAGFQPVTDSDISHYFGSSAGVRLDILTNDVDAKSAPGPYIRVGQPVYWTYVVTNTGNISLLNIAVSDDHGIAISCIQTSLSPGEHTSCTGSGTALPDQYTNTATVSAQPQGEAGRIYAADTSYYFGASPSIRIIKKTNGQDANEPPGPYIPVGEAINFQYDVSNSSEWHLEDVTVSDSSAIAVDCPKSDLQPGRSMTCSASAIALTGQQFTTGTAQANAEMELGMVTDNDLSHYFGYQLSLELVVKTNGQDISGPPGPNLAIGSTIHWTYLLRNHSNVPVSGIVVSDDSGVTVSCPKESLDADEQMTCSANGVVTAGPHSNTGQAFGSFLSQPIHAGTDTSYYVGTQALFVFLPLLLR